MLLSLLLVLALVGLCAWLLKRFALVPSAGSGLIRILAGASVGPRERIVLVQVSDQWLLLGVAPGQVRMLQSLPRSETADSPPAQTSAQPFAAWLQRMREARK